MKSRRTFKYYCLRLLFTSVRIILSLRYRVNIRGIEHLKTKSVKLILPNHQAIIDPVLLMCYIFKHSYPVPVLTASYYDAPGLNILFKTWGAIRVSDLRSGSRNINVLDNILEGVSKGFSEGKNIVLYPSGQLPKQGREIILNKKSAYKIVSEVTEDVQVIGVRIQGLWGSIWSKAWTGKSPVLGKVVLKGLFFTLANLIFFMPRRKITIEIESITGEAKNAAKFDKTKFNKFLEKFYNKHGEQKAFFLKHFFYAPKIIRKE